MMKREHDLLKLLSAQNHPVSSTYLAAQMGVSTNTVKKLVKQINTGVPEKIIASTKTGYQLTSLFSLSQKIRPDIPQNYLERAFYIIKEVLLSGLDIDIYNIAEDLFVSYSTVKATLQKMNKTFDSFHVRFFCKQDKILIDGSENNLRKLVVYVISEETNWQFINLEAIKRIFGTEIVNLTVNLIHSVFKKNNCSLNDFAFMNLTLHMLVFIERCEQGKHLPFPSSIHLTTYTQQPDNYRQLFSDLCSGLEELLSFSLTEGDRCEIYTIIASNASHANVETLDEVTNIVGEKTWNRIRQITLEISDLCKINLANEYFLPNFALHVKRIIDSDANSIYNRNPMLDIIKKDCQLIYDIAILFSLQLAKDFQITITEDETAYFALHVASEIDRQKSNGTKLQVVLFCPLYRELQSQLKNQLTQIFGHEIYIKETVSQTEHLQTLSYDFILSTVELPSSLNQKVILISPFLNEEKKSVILYQIREFKRIQKKQLLLLNFDRIFHEELFFYQPDMFDKETVIHTLCSKMYSLDFVPQNFEETVLERESAASTAFSKIAVPHSIRMNAIETRIAVVIDSRGIPWNNNTVNLVLLFAINYVDRSNFVSLYETLLAIFDEPKMISKLIQAKTLKQFKHILESGMNYTE